MTEKFVPKHFHLMLKATPKRTFSNPEYAKTMLFDLVRAVNMIPVTTPQAVYVEVPGNEGLTGSINLATSHVAFHVWDHDSLLQFDLYSCCSFEVEAVLTTLKKYFSDFSSYKYVLIDRENFETIEAATFNH